MSKKTEKNEDKNPQVVELEKELAKAKSELEKKARVIKELIVNNDSQAAQLGVLVGEKFSDRNHTALQSRIAELETKLTTREAELAEAEAELKDETEWHRVYKAQSDKQDADIKRLTAHISNVRIAIVNGCHIPKETLDFILEPLPGYGKTPPETPSKNEWETKRDFRGGMPTVDLAEAEAKIGGMEEYMAHLEGEVDGCYVWIEELEADVNVEKLRATLAEDEVKRLTERMRMAGVAIAAIREMAAPSGVGNDPNCTCSTCAHEFGQSDDDKEACKACGPAVVNHGTHPQWKRRDKQSAPESPEGIRWECCKECPKKQDCCRCGNFLDEVNKKLAEKERHHELEHKIILDLEAKLDITNRNAERADATIFDLQAKLAAADMKGLYWQMQFDYGAERYAEREKRIAELVFEGRALSERIADLELLNLNRAAEINRLSEPLKAHCCPTCTRWNQQRDHAGDGCHDCKTTSFEHWQSYLPSGEGKSSEGKSNWINNPHPEVMALWNRCIKAEEELAVAQKSASRRLEVINEKNEDLKRLEEQVKQLKYKNEQLAQLLGTADAQVKRMRACMNCWYGNEEVCRIKDFKECNYDHWKPSQVALKGMEGYLDTGKMRRGDLVEFKDGGKSAYYRITSVVTGVPFQRTASSPYWPKCGLAAGTCPQQKSMGPADILCGDPTYPCTSQIKKPEACKDRTADCQIDDCTDCDKQDEPKEAGK